MGQKFLAALHVLSRPAVAIGGAVVLAVLIIGGTYYLTSVGATGSYTPVATSTITEEVTANGAVQGAETTDLSFQIPGQVAAIRATVGTHVGAGQVLVALAGGSQAATLAGAEASLEAAEANLASIQAGTRPEQIAIDQNAVAQDQAALADAVRSAYVAADSAVHTTADQFFSNPRTASAQLTVTVPDSTLATRLIQERIALEPLLGNWGAQVSAIASGSGDVSTLASASVSNLTQVNAFLDDAAEALSKVQPSPSTPLATLNAYEASIGSARAALAGSLTALTGAKSALTSAQGALTLAQAGATPQAIAAAQAQVDAARAQVSSAQVLSGQTALTAPISGVITRQDAHIGQSVSPGISLISLQGTGAYEVKGLVSETDIAKVKVGDQVSATFDAYAGVEFPAVITAVDPAATITNGVATYTVTATFTGNDARIKSGMTAHLTVRTASAEGALVVPTSSIISTNGTQFVYLKNGKSNIQVSVTTGVSGGGMTQILSGLTAGQEVLTFGSSN